LHVWFKANAVPAKSFFRGALFERFVAVALQHQRGGTPDIDLVYHAMKTARLRSTKA
jgi:hypothetical protein